MVENSQELQEKEGKYLAGDLGSVGIGAALAGPFGAAAGLLANRLYRWGRGKYLQNQNKKKTNSNKQNINVDQEEEPVTSYSDEELQKKVQKAQDDIKKSGMFEPEVYNAHKFYQSTIYDERDPENNNFICISKNKNDGESAYNNFLEYWTEKWAQEQGNVSGYEKAEYKELIKDRFPIDANKECFITVPKYFIIGAKDVVSMAKNSDILDQEGVVYYNKPSFDSNFVYDTHMSQYKHEAIDNDNIEDYKISFISFEAYKTKYTYAFDMNYDEKRPDKEAETVMIELGQELANDIDEETLYAFSRVVEQLVESEHIKTNVYCVATPLLRKDAKTAKDLEYNTSLLDGIGSYENEEEFKKHYLEDYQKLLENQMGI